VPVLIAVVLIAVVVGGLLLFSRRGQSVASATVDPYADFLKISNLKLSAAENFIGGSVNYIDGTITNTGNKVATAISVDAIFRNSLGQTVQRETQPMMLIQHRPGFPDETIPISAKPLRPNGTQEFRLTFEHISADWDHGYPELRFARVDAKQP
jgi:hypothetical protein